MRSLKNLNEVNLEAIYKHFEKLCSGCDKLNTPECRESSCLIGFGKRALRFSISKGVLDIAGAKKMIPTGDFKVYYLEVIAPGLAETCRQCRQCQDNHSPDCVIALARTCLEYTVLQSEIDYPGSVFQYLAKVRDQAPELSALIAAELKKSS
ncbi:MAG: hypothetical protein HPY89_06395 [Pelotomaculum sp.]|uniref:Uncharacterized protein n=1 Tax=Pelotomaculum thermopropionicum (strain DSM 13744 / JCM 10971 / SI) TaxID=370438 RepID=A5D3K5_PELTS|nr:hypothetical protein [Pelotomaculum sp.]BAF59178.1 hypothetical protein PTH_0997 [Pelotomaculum thermopropionicum SI]